MENIEQQHTSAEQSGGFAGIGGPGVPLVGIVGMGTMGGALARHLLEAGYRVVGCDVEAEAVRAFQARGGSALPSAAAVADAADLVITSLPSVAAFEEVATGPAGLGAGSSSRVRVVVETSTLPLEVKEAGRAFLALRSIEMIDCPISGTGAQMAVKDVAFYMSGEPVALASAQVVLAACSRAQFDLGAFGNGTKLKLVANHLVAIHNASAAEALVLAERGGIDPAVALEALMAGAGTSRMLEMRGSMMVDRHFTDATMKVRTFQKDVDIITEFARQARCPLPVFAAAAQLNLAALASGHGEDDTASVHAVIEGLAGA